MVSKETMVLRDRDVLIDLESGTNDIVTDHSNTNEASSRVAQARAALNSLWNGLLGTDGCVKDDQIHHSNGCSSLEVALKNEGALLGRRSEGEEKAGLSENNGAEKPKKKRSKKPPRPPRSATALSLDAADQKLINELSELAMLKRARIERMKALKKMKNAKSASSTSNFCALLVTVIFCIVIIWQGIFLRHASSLSFHGSPESSVGANGGLISVQLSKNDSTISPGGSTSSSPNNVETTSGLAMHGEAGMLAG